jgi:hypothetical protein
MNTEMDIIIEYLSQKGIKVSIKDPIIFVKNPLVNNQLQLFYSLEELKNEYGLHGITEDWLS